MAFNIAWLSVTYSCNNRCTWCYAEDNLSAKNEMSQEIYSKSFNLLRDLEVRQAILIGGEPTMHPSLDKIILASQDYISRIGLVTNGRKLSNKQYAQKLKSAGLDSAIISIEGSTEKIHDSITNRKGSFVETLNGIKNCIDTKIITGTETTICKENIDDLYNILELTYTLGIKTPGFNICTCPIGKEKFNSSLDLVRLNKIMETLYNLAKSKNKQLRFITPFPICNINSKLKPEMLEKGILRGRCSIYFGLNFVIDYNGDVLPCTHFGGYPLFNITNNFSKEDFLDNWNTPTKSTYKFREKLWTYPSTKCNGCKDWASKCMGGCPMLWLNNDAQKEIVGD